VIWKLGNGQALEINKLINTKYKFSLRKYLKNSKCKTENKGNKGLEPTRVPK